MRVVCAGTNSTSPDGLFMLPRRGRMMASALRRPIGQIVWMCTNVRGGKGDEVVQNMTSLLATYSHS
jgi:hypothetical protein